MDKKAVAAALVVGGLTLTGIAYALTKSSSPTTGLSASLKASTTGNLDYTFTAVVSGGTAPYTYAWNFGDGATSTEKQPSHTYTVAGTYNVKLTVTDAAGTTKIIIRSVSATSGGGGTGVAQDVHAVLTWDATPPFKPGSSHILTLSLTNPTTQAWPYKVELSWEGSAVFTFQTEPDWSDIIVGAGATVTKTVTCVMAGAPGTSGQIDLTISNPDKTWAKFFTFEGPTLQGSEISAPTVTIKWDGQVNSTPTFDAGTNHTLTVTVKNNLTTAGTYAIEMLPASDDFPGIPWCAPVSIAPGQSHDFIFDFTAPGIEVSPTVKQIFVGLYAPDTLWEYDQTVSVVIAAGTETLAQAHLAFQVGIDSYYSNHPMPSLAVGSSHGLNVNLGTTSTDVGYHNPVTFLVKCAAFDDVSSSLPAMGPGYWVNGGGGITIKGPPGTYPVYLYASYVDVVTGVLHTVGPVKMFDLVVE